jgi:hypothetical protein
MYKCRDCERFRRTIRRTNELIAEMRRTQSLDDQERIEAELHELILAELDHLSVHAEAAA